MSLTPAEQKQPKYTVEGTLEEKLVEQLFKTYYSPLCKLVNRLVNDKDAAKDIVQDVFLKIWKSKENLDAEKSVKSYIYRAAIHTAYNYLERDKKFVRIEEPDIDAPNMRYSHTEEQYNATELSAIIDEALEKLPPRCKAVFILSRYENMTYKEISESLDIAPKTVENQMSKALELLRNHLKDYLIILLLFILSEKYFQHA